MTKKGKHKAPGKSDREGISLLQLSDLFPDEESAVKWFESVYWPDERCCGHCGSVKTREIKNRKPMPYWCQDCKRYFSVRTGTALQSSRLPLRKWAFAVYLYVTNLKGVSSMKLHRDLGVTQKTAWYMLHRLRQSWDASRLDEMEGPVEIDETYMGGKRKNMSLKKRKRLKGRGAVGEDGRSRAEGPGHEPGPGRGHARHDPGDGLTVHHGAREARGEVLHGRLLDLPRAAEPRVGQALGGRVRPGAGPHQRDRVVLVNAQAGAHRDLPQDERQAPPAVRLGVHPSSQYPGRGYHRPDAGRRGRTGGQAADVSGLGSVDLSFLSS